jgi:hypothetical protein
LLHGGIARCGKCGWALAPYEFKRKRRSDGTTPIVYRCQQRNQFGPGTCEGIYISADSLDYAVINAIDEHLGRGDYLDRLFAAWDQDAAAVSGVLKDIDRQIADVQQRIKNAQDYVMRHGESDPLAAGITAQARLAAEEFPRLQARRAAAERKIEAARANLALRDEMQDWMRAWAFGFYALPQEKQRTFLKALGATVRVWRADERTPQARLTLAMPTSAKVLPPPFDVEANVAAYGAEANVDAEGIYVDTVRGERFARDARKVQGIKIKGSKLDIQSITGEDEGVTANEVMAAAKEAATGLGEEDVPNSASLS